MYRRFTLLSRSFATHENIFKQYLKQAEQIAQEAKQKAEEVKQDTAQTLGTNFAASTDPALKYLRASRLIDKLVSARSTEKMQLVMEEAFYDVSKTYKAKKDQESDVLKPSELAEKLMVLWDERPDLKVLNVPPNTIFRTIWAHPVTEVHEDFGKFQRITKDQEGEFSPFFYGEFGETFYMSMIKGVGSSQFGIRIIRRVIDHMAAFEQKPSTELVSGIINECITGRWPRVMLSTLEYAVHMKTAIPIETWGQVINFYRYCKEHYEKASQCVELALASGVTPDWNIISPLVSKHLKHKQFNEAQAMVDRVRAEILNRSRAGAILVREEQAVKTLDLVKNFIYSLVEWNMQRQAHNYFESYIKDASVQKIDESYEIGFKFYEDIEDGRNGIAFYESLKSDKKFVYTQKMVVALLKMTNKCGKAGVPVAEEQETAIFANADIYSPFALNILISLYGKYELWDKVLRIGTKIRDDKPQTNKYTKIALDKQIERCLDPSFKKKMLEVVNEISFTEPSS